MRVNYLDMVNWIEKNRVGHNCFIGDRESLEQYILNKARNQMMLYSVSLNTGLLNGIVCYNSLSNLSMLYVENILTTDTQALKNFIRKLKELYPSWIVQGNRRDGKTVIYNTPRLISLVESL